VDQVVYKGERVPVFAGYRVKRTIVLYKAEFAILLLDEEDRCTYRRPGWADAASGEGLLEKRIKFLLLFQRHGVHLMETGLWVAFELDCVVPFALVG
jgi:hypothetical protein